MNLNLRNTHCEGPIRHSLPTPPWGVYLGSLWGHEICLKDIIMRLNCPHSKTSKETSPILQEKPLARFITFCFDRKCLSLSSRNAKGSTDQPPFFPPETNLLPSSFSQRFRASVTPSAPHNFKSTWRVSSDAPAAIKQLSFSNTFRSACLDGSNFTNAIWKVRMKLWGGDRN